VKTPEERIKPKLYEADHGKKMNDLGDFLHYFTTESWHEQSIGGFVNRAIKLYANYRLLIFILGGWKFS
jgi:hypothetical protein